MQSTIEVLKIDNSSPDPDQLAAKYRDLRLSALEQSPDAFASTFEQESKHPQATWISRLIHPNKKTFICVDKSSPEEEGKWVAQVTLLGPIRAEAYRLPAESGQPEVLDDDIEEKWQMLGLYTLSSHRGKGLAKVLCQAAFADLKISDRGPRKVRVRLMVKPQNTVTVNLYSSMGFADVGRCTLQEALVANWETDQIPEEPLPEKYKTRQGVIMELRLKR